MKYKELGLYIHIPFCKQKCFYCDFLSYQDKSDEIEKYMEALNKEIESYNINEEFLNQYNVTTLYIGGGTPSYIDSKYIKFLLDNLKDKLKNNKTNFEEIEKTIEINPGTITKSKLKDYKEAGINRVSIGLQSTSNKLLKDIGRIHTYEQFLDTYKMVKEIRFDNINVDLMIGLPNQTIKDIKSSLEKVINLDVNHVSVYSLIIEEDTKLATLIDEGKMILPDEETERRMYWYVKDFLELNGYEHYEISNFAKNKQYSRHNMNCWEQKEYIGFGVAAHSYLNDIRYSNVENIGEYMEQVSSFTNGKKIYRRINEKQLLEDKENEYMLLGLRKIEGVSISRFKEKFVENPIFKYREKLDFLVSEGLLIVDGDFVRLTNKGLDLANFVWEEFV